MMKNDLTTWTWQDNTGCPININLGCTSDVRCSLESPSLQTWLPPQWTTWYGPLEVNLSPWRMVRYTPLPWYLPKSIGVIVARTVSAPRNNGRWQTSFVATAPALTGLAAPIPLFVRNLLISCYFVIVVFDVISVAPLSATPPHWDYRQLFQADCWIDISGLVAQGCRAITSSASAAMWVANTGWLQWQDQ